MNRSQTVRGYLMVILSAVIFGCMPMMAKFIYDGGINSLSLVLMRNLLSLPVVGLAAFRQRGSLRIPRKAVPSIAAIGITGCCVAPTLLFSSYFYIASGTATVFHFVYPAAVVLGGVLCCRERVTPGNLVSVLLCVVGIALFYNPGDPLDWRGSTLALLSGVVFAAYVLMLSHFKHREVSGFLLNFYIFAINSLVMLGVCLAAGLLTLPATLGSWMFYFFFALVTNVCAVAMFQQGTFLIGGQQASILSTLEPITGVFMGALVFRETVGLRTALGSGLVIAASILIVLSEIHGKKQNTRL